jgi:hypothetical protein
MLMSGAKRSTSGRTGGVDPNAERRLRASFPEVWAWYELLLTARGGAPGALADQGRATAPRRSVRR